MAGEDAAPVDVPGGVRARAVTGGIAEHRRVAIPIEVIEFEDALFNEGGCVLMPERLPAGEGEEDDEFPNSFQLLALTYRQFEIDNRKKMLVAGHHAEADTNIANFMISRDRAKNVLYLLTGERDLWSQVAAGRHGILDYQRLLKYFNTAKGWGCDPGELNGEWNEATQRAVGRFFDRYNSRFAPRAQRVPRNLATTIQSDENKLWPAEAWNAVFNLYMDMLRRALNIPLAQLSTLRSLQNWAHADKYTSCGNRFPVHADYEDSYRTDNHGRVEVLLLYRDITVFICPEAPGADGEFPLCHRGNYTLTFPSLDDLTIVPYHLKFTYYDRVKNAITPVPNFLDIKVFTRNNREINGVRKVFQDGVYIIKVPEDQISRIIYFTFETVPSDPWPPAQSVFLFTAASGDNPVERPLTPAQVTALTPVDRLKYYDLPHKWSSRNYWTRYQRNGEDQGARFERAARNNLRLKPYGSAKTKASEALTFSLDDIVLATNARNQDVKDLQENGRTQRNLSNNSRYTLFHIDHTAVGSMAEVDYDKKKEMALRIFDPDPDNPVFSKEKLPQNLITKVPNDARIVSFAGGFYSLFDKRSSDRDPQFNLSNGRHVLGARMAVLEDTSLHIKKVVDGQNDADVVTKNYSLRRPGLNACGNYELHYFHNCATLNSKMLSYLIVYWSCRFQRVNQSGGILRGTTQDVENHRKEGMINAMKRSNKDYLIEKHTGTDDIIIRPFHFFEAKMAGYGGKHKALVNIVQNFKSDSADAGAWMSPEVSQLRARDFEGDPDYFGVGDPDNALQDVDGESYEVLTNHHEFGHATGNWDDYLYDYNGEDGDNWNGLPRYSQPFTAEGGPYTCDKLSRMRVNRIARMRDFWKFVCWLHDDSADNAKPLHPFFHGTRFKLSFVGSSHTHAFHLDETYRNVAVASHSAINRTLSGTGKADLLLYKLGDGELSHLLHSGQVFNGILVVRTKFAFKFDNTAAAWPFTAARTWARNLSDDLRTMLNGTDGKFRITCPNDNDFKNIYLHFVPHVDVYDIDATGTPVIRYTYAPPAESHFNIEVQYQFGHGFTAAGKTLSVDFGDNADSGAALRERIIRYCFGKTTAGAVGRTHIPDILSWVQSEVGSAGNVFQVHDL